MMVNTDNDNHGEEHKLPADYSLYFGSSGQTLEDAEETLRKALGTSGFEIPSKTDDVIAIQFSAAAPNLTILNKRKPTLGETMMSGTDPIPYDNYPFEFSMIGDLETIEEVEAVIRLGKQIRAVAKSCALVENTEKIIPV